MPMAAAIAAAPNANKDIDDDLVSVQSRCTAHIASLDIRQIAEVASYSSPPGKIRLITQAVGALKGANWSDWGKAQKGMKPPQAFKDSLMAFELDSVTPATIIKMKTFISTDEAFASQIKSTSAAAYGIYHYLKEIIEYHEGRQ